MEEDCLYREQCRQEAEEDTEWNMLQYIGIIFLNIDNIVYYLLAKVFWYSKLQLENMLGGNSEVDTFSSLIKNRSQTRTRTVEITLHFGGWLVFIWRQFYMEPAVSWTSVDL